MTDSELDDLLRRALLDAVREDYAQELARETGEEVVPPSPGYLRRRRRLLRDPFAYARRFLQPAWKRALKTAACLLLAVSVTLAGVLCASPQARAWVQRVIVEWFETYTSFRFTDAPEEGAEIGEWRPTYLPDGFIETNVQNLDGLLNIFYENSTGEYIQLTYLSTSQGRTFDIDNENVICSEIAIKNYKGSIFVASDNQKSNSIVWIDSKNYISFLLTSRIHIEELIKVAESICQT